MSVKDRTGAEDRRAAEPTTAGAYWDDVAGAWRRSGRQRLWREYSDRHQLALIARWVGGRAGGDVGSAPAVLKTDLFDEVAGRGLAAGLTTAGLRVTAVDISPLIVAEAAARHPDLEAVVADVRSLPFVDGSFDIVFSASTLDHFDTAADISVALGELRRVLKPGGRLVLTLDNPANPLIWLRNGPLLTVLRGVGIVPYQVGATLGPRALAAAVRDAGFEVAEATAVMHCPRVAAVAIAPLVERLPRMCRDAFLRCLAACELLEGLPTRWLTGHYIAIHAGAREPEAGGAANRMPKAVP